MSFILLAGARACVRRRRRPVYVFFFQKIIYNNNRRRSRRLFVYCYTVSLRFYILMSDPARVRRRVQRIINIYCYYFFSNFLFSFSRYAFYLVASGGRADVRARRPR